MGKSVAIVGAGGIGFDMAEFLAHGTSVFYTAAAPLAEAYAGPVFVLDMPVRSG